jgi:hypothetical protein
VCSSDLLAEGIDWTGQTDRFLDGDFGGLVEEERQTLSVLLELTSQVSAMRGDPADAMRLLLAYLALRFVTHSSAAKAFAVRVLLDPEAVFLVEIDELVRSRFDRG